MLVENAFILNIYDAMERLRKKGKGKYEDNGIELCEKELYVGRKVDTNILELAVQTNMIQIDAISNKMKYRLFRCRKENSVSK